ncbi:hypothetical protein [Algoriphagus confluentis]|uniref:Uncharacterized protein n=1 Tax=Algoriphagus confluentis TaxID=1697556 RepID=A0ABQ6PVP3_9BACT|nr:hypothetical protein Aconfl_43410 [Algoriphagus confluentis]
MFMIFSPVLVMAQAVTIPNNSGGNPFYLWAYGNTNGTTHMRIGTDFGHQGDAALEIFQHFTNAVPPQPGKVIVNGNLGVGTQNPTERLAVNGNIKAREVNVTTAGWADFVFDSEFELMPLSDLATFIETNGHLPGIPTESEVMENGIWLSEMNVKLLQKVEELTLYILRQEEKIKELQLIKENYYNLEARLNSIEKMGQTLNSNK